MGIVFLLSFGPYLSAQKRTIIKLGEPDRIFTDHDGLISNSCYGLTQDMDGFIWIYSEKGVSKFDGHSFKNYTMTSGLISNNIWMMSVDSMNRKWLHSHEKKFQYILDDKINDGIPTPLYKVALLVPYNKTQLYSLESNRRLNYIIEDSGYSGPSSFSVKTLNPQNNIYTIKDYQINISFFADTLKINNVKNKNSWTLTTGGEFRTPTYINGKIQISRQEGIDIFSENQDCISYEFDKSIQINRGMIDMDNNIWIATKQNGIYLFESNHITKQKRIWPHNLSLNEKVKFDSKHAYSNPSDEIYDFELNTRNLIKLIKAPNCKFISKIKNNYLIFGYSSNYILESPNFNQKKELLFYFLGNSEPLFIYTTQKFSELDLLGLSAHEKSLNQIIHSNNAWNIKTIWKWHTRPIWLEIEPVSRTTFVCVDRKIFLFDSTLTLTDSFHIDIPNINLSPSLYSIDFNKKEIYVSSNDVIYKVSKYNTEKIHELRNISGLKIAGNFLITFNNNCCNLFDVNACSNVEIFCNDNKEDEVSGRILDAFYTDDSLIVLKQNTIETFHISSEPKQKNHIQLHNPNYEFWFTHNYDTIYISTEDSIKTVELSCSILDPNYANHTGYKFKFLNSTQWQYSEVNRIYLGELPEGIHQILVVAYDRNTLEEISTKTIYCIVKTPWYNSKWFKIFLLISFIGVVVYFTRYFINRRYKELMRINQALLENRSLKLKALEAQMNPHFIYNSLGAIQSLVQTQNYSKAENYIIKFSKLLRMLLDSLRKNEVSLEREIEHLSHYLEIEKFRFNERFKYFVDVDPKLELESVYIPNMLIQPFVENAINHGLFHRIDGAELKLRIFKSKSDLFIEILDNGIGIKQAKEKYTSSRLGHESHALNIINEKIELFKNLHNYFISINTEDANPDDPMFPGTKVTICFEKILDNE